MAHNGVNNKRREETHWVIVYTLGTSGRGDASFQVAQSLSSGAARTVLFLTTFLWLSCSHAPKTPQSPRGNLGNPAAFLSSGVPHSGPNTLFVSFVLSCHPQHDPSRTRKHFRNGHTTHGQLGRFRNQCIAMWKHLIGRPTPSAFAVPDAWYWSPLGPIPTRYRQSTRKSRKAHVQRYLSRYRHNSCHAMRKP
jgi:hypothetical protein